MKYYLPNQHGAWSMLALPFVYGLMVTETIWLHVLLFVCWLLVYLFSFPLLQWVKTRRAERYRKPVLVYAALLVPCAAAMVIAKPGLLWFALPFLPLFGVNAYYARKRQERALINDIAAIVSFCLIVFPVVYVGGGDSWQPAGLLFALALLYFIGTALYVKTIIREKNNPAYYRASILYHVGYVVWGVLLLPFAVLPFLCVLLARAIVVPRLSLSIKQSGMLEIVFSAMMVAAGLVAI